jgi:serine/threonine protein phosphatase PrpC
MKTDLVLRCPACEHDALADDEFCESCGLALGVLRDGHRNHFEIETERAAGVSDRGLVHRRNEDALFVESIGTATVAIVCDGVSTSIAPQVAAETAAVTAGAEIVAALRESRASWSPERVLIDALAAANSAVIGVPWMPQPGSEGPSCTIVAVVWDGSAVSLAWTGDSRAYWVSGTEARQVTTDHSWAQEQIDAGCAEPHVVLADPRAHAITRWLGPDAPDSPPPTASFEPDTAGRLIVCSDGLWNHLESTDELGVIVADAGHDAMPIEIARTLTDIAVARGGHDNVTVAVIEIAPSLRNHDEELRT